MIAEAPAWNLPIDSRGNPRLSISLVKSWLTCPACFKAQYIDRQPVKRSIHLPLGSLAHAAVEVARRQAMAEREANLDQCLTLAQEVFRASTKGARAEVMDVDGELSVSVTEPDSEPGPQDLDKYASLADAENFGMRLARIAVPRIIAEERRIGIEAIEEWLDFEGVFPFAFSGRIDVRLKDGRTRDVKTAGRNDPPGDDTALQLATYLMPAWMFGHEFNRSADTVVIVKKDDRVDAAAFPIYTHSLTLTDAAIAAAHNQIMEVARAISAGIFPVGQGFYGRHDVAHSMPTYKVAV